MVRLTMTLPIVEGLKKRRDAAACDPSDASEPPPPDASDSNPSLVDPEVGKPITHKQIIDLWQSLRTSGDRTSSLESLLQGSRVYIPPPPPKPEPTKEYKALMARLRREEEERSYQHMLKRPTARMDAFARQFPGASNLTRTHAFAEVNRPSNKLDEGDDDVTYEDVHRQLMLLLNFLVSIFGVAATIWVAARWWSTPARLFVTMGGAIVVGIAEVVVYNGYIWRMDDAQKKEQKVQEVREVVQTWEVGAEGEGNEKPADEQSGSEEKEKVTLLDTKDTKATETDDGVRRRLKGQTTS